MLYGARQVGKTYILKEFGQNEFEDFVYINCFRNSAVATIFAGDADVRRILLGLSAYAGKRIEPGRTLLFLDEVQEIPPIVSSLKYFCEDMPQLHIVVAGSLLGVMNMQGESFPVGKVDILHLQPMTFDEFLLAMGEKMLVDILKKGDYSLIAPFDARLKELLRQYYFVGGMPEAVSRFVQRRDIHEVRQVQNDILTSYETDIAKHTADATQRVRMVWQSIPAQLARENKKFVYGAIRKGARAKDFEIAIQWLIDAGLVYKVNRSRDAKMPLKFYADNDAFKLYLIDIGLLGALSMTPASQMLIGDNVFSEFKGAFTENYVLQQMIARQEFAVYYFSKDNSSLEIDFLVQSESRIIPIEVKAEENVKSKSLSTFVNHDFESYHLKGMRFSMKGYQNQEWMENIPLYMVAIAPLL